MKYTITKVYKRRLDCEVEANSLEEALEFARKSKHWKWDEGFGYDIESGEWIATNGKSFEDGELTEEQLQRLARIKIP